MAKKRAMDSAEKILFHKDWLKKWEKNPFDVYPIYIEITPAGWCNHRCVFCAFDYIGYKKVKLDAKILIARVEEMAELGVKAIQYAGEGEPLLHFNLAEIMLATHKAGIEISMLTNGILLTKNFVDKTLSAIKWFQASIDAGIAETYADIHRANPKDFARVLANLTYAVEVRNREKIRCEIGAQMILLPQNYKEAVLLAKLLKEAGADYFTLKPYSHHPLSLHSQEEIVDDKFKYGNILFLEKELKEVAGKELEIDFRKTAMNEIETERSYDRCWSVPNAWAHVMADGNVYACSAYLGDERFLLGNINRQTFQEIWQGEKRKNLLEKMKDYDAKEHCRRICRMNRTNITLVSLKAGKKIKPGPKPNRINFI